MRTILTSKLLQEKVTPYTKEIIAHLSKTKDNAKRSYSINEVIEILHSCWRILLAGEKCLEIITPEERNAFLILRIQIEIFEYAIIKQYWTPTDKLWERISNYYSKKTNYQICLHKWIEY